MENNQEFKLKLSASVINLWQRGDKQGVYDALHGIWRPSTPQMEYGTQKHKEWEEEVNRTGCLPEIFGGEKIINPITEHYYRKEIMDWLWLSGIVDLEFGENGEVIVDYKTGKGTANSYANSFQVACYALLRPQAKMFRFYAYNQYEDKVTSSVIHLNDRKRVDWQDDLFSIACDIRAWLEDIEPYFNNISYNSHKQG